MDEYKKFFLKTRQNRSGVEAKVEKRAGQRVQAAQKSPLRKPPSRVKAKRQRSAVKPILFLSLALGASLTTLLYLDEINHWVEKIEVSVAESRAANSSESKVGEKEKSPQMTGSESGSVASVQRVNTEEDLSHFSRLAERQKELDLRERELNELEEELHKQRLEVEDRIRRLEEMRRGIASVLKQKVEMDDQKITTLVEFYSNMKPQKAAEILGTIDENLAVEILGRMKKKNAAEILNLLKSDKAQVLSEKYAGYKRR